MSTKPYLVRNIEDVDVTGVLNGDSLIYNSSQSKWLAGTPGGESWEGKVHVTIFNGNPSEFIHLGFSTNTNVSPALTPTNIGVSVGRLVSFKFSTSITVATIRWLGEAAVSNAYTTAIYRDSDGARLWYLNPTNTINNWSSSISGLPITLDANTLYWFGIGTATTGTTAGFVTPQRINNNFWLASPAWTGLTTAGIRYCQVVLTNGAWTDPLPVKADATWASGTLPVFFLCASGE